MLTLFIMLSFISQLIYSSGIHGWILLLVYIFGFLLGLCRYLLNMWMNDVIIIYFNRMAANDDEVDNEHAKKGKLGKLEDKIKKGYKIGKDFYAKLKEFYNFPKDRNEEISILRETLKAL